MDPLAMLAQLQRGGRSTPSLPVPTNAGAMVRALGMMPQQAESAAPTAGEPEGPTEPGGDTSDEDMLETVRAGMGGGGPGGAQGDAAPPPGSGMKWMDIDEDRAALIADPSPENMQAFVDYWGADQLPPELQQSQSEEGAPYDVAEAGQVKPLPMVNTQAPAGSIERKGLTTYDRELGRQPSGSFGINPYKQRG